MQTKEDERNIYSFAYLDESSTSGNRYFGCGILVHGPKVSGRANWELNRWHRQWQARCGFRLRADIGWKKVPSKPGNYLSFYLNLVKSFFQNAELSFHALVVDTSAYPLDSNRFFKSSKEHGIDAFAYHLIRARALRFPGGSERLHIKLDRREQPPALSTKGLGVRLRKADKIFAAENTRSPLTVRLNSVEGGRHPFVHLSDLLLGAVTADLNGKTRSKGKLAVLEDLRRCLGRRPGEATSATERKFNIWHFEVPPIHKS